MLQWSQILRCVQESIVTAHDLLLIVLSAANFILLPFMVVYSIFVFVYHDVTIALSHNLLQVFDVLTKSEEKSKGKRPNGRSQDLATIRYEVGVCY